MDQRPSPSAVQASREVRAVISRLRRRILNAAEAEDLTLGQASVPARLSGEQGVTAGEPASAEGVRHQSMTATVAAPAVSGLVRRRPDPDDGRRLLIALTSAGLLRTFAYVGSMVASSTTAVSFGQRADTGGMHDLAWTMLGTGVLYLLLTVFDRSLGRVARGDASAGAP